MQRQPLVIEGDHQALDTSQQLDLNAQRALHNLQTAFTIAKKFPRDREQAVQNILNECKRISLASKALYEYPKGKTSVRGTSIRLAETIARYWGNLDCGVREISRTGNRSLVESFAIDLETNNRKSLEFEVVHQLDTKEGGKALVDERSIYEHIANMGARRLRACIQAAIPADVFESAVKACEETLNDEDRKKPMADRVRAMVSMFDGIGVKVEHLEQRLNHKLDLTTEEELREMGAIYNSLKDNMSVRTDWFDIAPAKKAGNGMAGFKDRLGLTKEPEITSVEIDGELQFTNQGVDEHGAGI